MISQLVAYLGLAVVCACTLRNPVVGLSAYWVLALARLPDVYWWWGETRLSFWVALAVCGAWLYGWSRNAYRGPGLSGLDMLVFAFFLLKVLSAWFAADQTGAWNHVAKVSPLVLSYYATVRLVDSRGRLRAIGLVMAASLAFLALWGNWQWYGEGMGGGGRGELAGPGWQVGRALADRNVFGYMLAIGVPICLFTSIVEGAPWIRWPALACLPFLANAVMLTFGRAAFLGMMTGSVWSLVRLRRPRLVVLGAVVGALMMYRLAGPEVVARVLTIETYQEDRSATVRIEAWKAGVRMMGDFPLLGVGPGNFGRYSAGYNPEVPEGLVAHNEFIEAAAETGIASALVLAAIVALMLRDLARVRRRAWPALETRWAYYYAAMLEASLLSYLVGAMFVSLPFFELFYLLIALTVCLRRVVEESPAEMAAVQEPAPDRPGQEWWRPHVPGGSAVS